MTWVLAMGLALGAFAVIAFVFKVSATTRSALGATLLFGLAGYGLQASPGLPGAPKAPLQNPATEAAAMVEARQALAGQRQGVSGNDAMVTGDAFARHGQFADAVGIYRGAVEKNPRDAEAWLALANAMTAHADGNLTPAAMLAFRRASAAAPGNPGPPYFLGMALAQTGRYQEAREVWGRLLAASPVAAPWREELVQNLARLDGLIKEQPAP